MNLTDYKIYRGGAIFKRAPHCEVKLSSKEMNDILSYYHIWFVRNIYDFDCQEKTSFWFIIKDTILKIEDMPSKARNQVRKSLKMLDIRLITQKDLFCMGGYEVYASSFERYKNCSKPVSEQVWKTWIDKNENEIQYWGAFEKETNKLIAYIEVLVQDNMAKYTTLKGIPWYLNKYYPFYGMLFVLNKYYIEERGLKYVTDGARSVTEHSNIQSFLFKFGFRKAYCKLSVRYVWWLKIIVMVLFPFRNIVPWKQIKNLLRFEAMQRGENI